MINDVGSTYFVDGECEKRYIPLDDALASAFWSNNGDDAYFWAWQAVHHAAKEQVDGVVAFLVALADAAEGRPDDLAYLGADVFETLLRYGDRSPSAAILDELDAAALRNENVRVAVQAIWWGTNDDQRTVDRFSRFGSNR